MEMTAKPEVVKPGAKTAVEKQSIETAELEGVSHALRRSGPRLDRLELGFNHSGNL
jgi:hypothetical protein